MHSDDSNNATMPAAPSVFGPHRLVSLLLTPRAYFSHPDLLRDRRGILIAAALSGFASAMDRIDQKLVKADLAHQELNTIDPLTLPAASPCCRTWSTCSPPWRWP